MFLATDLAAFKKKFGSQLNDMLASDSLGAFILVLANSMQDAELYDLLKQPLKQQFAKLSKNTPDAPIDDLLVFNNIKKSGIASITCWEYFQAQSWGIIYNPLRAMRPARSSETIIDHIHQPFNADAFHFNKPFLKPEILWEGLWNKKQYRVLYNKFPFAPWHLLIVPEANKQQPQYLTQKAHQHIFKLSIESTHLPGLAVAFNSLGAYASINQLHFQGFIYQQPLPIEVEKWQHNGGKEEYPVKCSRYSTYEESWTKINQLHRQNQPYNLLYRDGLCYVIPRKGQGTVKLSEWGSAMGWYEMCGIFTILDYYLATHLSSMKIERELKQFNKRSSCL